MDDRLEPSRDQALRDRGGAKWDKAARYLRIAMTLHANSGGISAADIAKRLGVSKRTVYRDLESMSLDAELPIWQDGGRWGLEDGAFLPPLALTLDEAMTLFLAARVLAKASDEHDSELIGAFVKLAEILPPVLAEHVRATIDAYAATPHRRTRASRASSARSPRRGRTGAWWRSTTGRGVRPRQAAAARAGAAVCDRAVGADAGALPGGLRRGARRAAHVQGGADPGGQRDAGDVRSATQRPGGTRHAARLGRDRGRAAGSGGGALLARTWRHAWPRRAGTRARSWSASPTARCCGPPRSPGRARSGRGSSAGARTRKCWSRPSCARKWRDSWPQRRALPVDGGHGCERLADSVGLAVACPRGPPQSRAARRHGWVRRWAKPGRYKTHDQRNVGHRTRTGAAPIGPKSRIRLTG